MADSALAHQLGRVLRLGPGDHVLFLDGQGAACDVTLTALGRDEVRGQVTRRTVAPGEPPFTLTLYLPLIRPERFEWALQKSVELGVSHLVPLVCARARATDHPDARRLERWQRIVREAAEQACRGLLPTVAAPTPFAVACAQAATAELALFLWEGEAPSLRAISTAHRGSSPASEVPTTRARPATIAVLSGPEGGFSPTELALAHAQGLQPVSLGPRILRAETAPIAAAAFLMLTFAPTPAPPTPDP